MMMTGDPKISGVRDDSTLRKELSTRLTEVVRWSPAMLLLLYVLGYVAANSHYARFELIKPTLLTGRYLSAGLLYVAFAAVPAAAGFACVLHAAARQRRLSGRANVRYVYLTYLLVVELYAFFLSTVTMHVR